MNGHVQELEFQVSTVLNRLEEAVEKFDGKGTISSLKVNQSLNLAPKSPHEIISILQVSLVFVRRRAALLKRYCNRISEMQDAIVNLNLSKEDEEPNLAILPALREVEKLAILAHSIKQYLLCLDVVHTEYLLNWIQNESTHFLKQLFGLVR